MTVMAVRFSTFALKLTLKVLPLAVGVAVASVAVWLGVLAQKMER